MKIRSKRRRFVHAAWIALLLVMSGCMYPKDQTPGGDVPARQAVLTVQDAVERYKEATGLLPILNADAEVPVYEKYKVDFAKMKRMGYVSSIPAVAFESGGPYAFLIIDEETDPKVKLLDIAVHQGIADLQKKIDAFRVSHGNANPDGEEAYPGFHYVDYGKLGTSRPALNSMFSRQPLELMVDGNGKVYADYGIDVATALKKAETAPEADADLRALLADASDFVPVKSPVYRLADGEPVAKAAE